MYIVKNKSVIKYYKDKGRTILHREDGPAVEWYDGYKEWHLDGKLFRDVGPCIECNTYKEWYLDGKLHREDGPAIEYFNGENSWYYNGVRYDYKGVPDKFYNYVMTFLLS